MVVERCLREPFGFVDDFNDPYELYSPQMSFSSEWRECPSPLHRRLNRTVERDLCRYTHTHTVTSDVYKDQQRKDVYDTIDAVGFRVGADGRVLNQVKLLFHEYRTKMYRVHKKEVAILALFHIVMELNSHRSFSDL